MKLLWRSDQTGTRRCFISKPITVIYGQAVGGVEVGDREEGSGPKALAHKYNRLVAGGWTTLYRALFHFTLQVVGVRFF